MDPNGKESLENVIAFVNSLPDFPNKALVLQRLETGNLNRYQEALLTINDTLSSEEAPLAGSNGEAVTREQLQTVVNRIALLQAQEQVAE